MSSDGLTVRPVGARPAVWRYGRWWSEWDQQDYRNWFGKVMKWSAHEVDTTPVGVLDAIIDRTKTEHEEHEQARRKAEARNKAKASMRAGGY